MKELIPIFTKAGGKILCMLILLQHRGLAKNNLVGEATVVSDGKLIEILSGGTLCITQ